MKKVMAILLLALGSITATSQIFSDDLPGIESLRKASGGIGVINDMYNDGDSLLYIIGGIYKVNDIPINCVFAWDGENIRLHNEGADYAKYGVDCIIKYNDTIYMGGV